MIIMWITLVDKDSFKMNRSSKDDSIFTMKSKTKTIFSKIKHVVNVNSNGLDQMLKNPEIK